MARFRSAHADKEYFGYFGTFSIDPKKQVVTHHVEGSWFPTLEGGDQERHYRFEDDLLVLDADTDWEVCGSSGARRKRRQRQGSSHKRR